MVAFFQLLTQSQNTGVRRLGVTQELLSLVTGLAHYLKLLIRICLQGALRLERETGTIEGLTRFLDHINSLEEKLAIAESAEATADSAYISEASDTCPVCKKPVEDKCARLGERVFHTQCLRCQKCSRELDQNLNDARWSEGAQKLLCANCAVPVPDAGRGFVFVSKLTHYVHLLKVAHARLLATLRTSGALPHTSGELSQISSRNNNTVVNKQITHSLQPSDDPNLTEYDSNQGHRVAAGEDLKEAPLLRADTRSKSFAGSSASDAQAAPSSYEETLGDIRRMRSTRMDKHLSTTMRHARTSRVMDGPYPAGGRGDGTADGNDSRSQPFQMVQDRDADADGAAPRTFGSTSIALDDIPRLVAAEQAKEQRPNAAKFARGHLISSEPKAKLINGQRRDMSGGNDLEKPALEPSSRTKKYFSELSALEFFIVRHVAVLSMEPLLAGHFNQEELLDLIETKRPTFWNKFGIMFNKDKNKSASKKKGMFGVALDVLVERDSAESTDGVGPGALKIPALIQDIVSAMRTMDMSVEGVFRKNGNIRRLRELQEEIDAKGVDAVDLDKENPVQVAALLKKFLRSLPDPVMTFKLYRLFITSQRKYLATIFLRCMLTFVQESRTRTSARESCTSHAASCQRLIVTRWRSSSRSSTGLLPSPPSTRSPAARWTSTILRLSLHPTSSTRILIQTTTKTPTQCLSTKAFWQSRLFTL